MELSIPKDLFNLELVLAVEAYKLLYCVDHNLCGHFLHYCCYMILNVSGYSDQEWYLVYMHHTDGQDDLVIVVLYVLRYREYVQLYSSFLFPHKFFRPGIL